MSQSTKKFFSTIAIIIASVAFGVLDHRRPRLHAAFERADRDRNDNATGPGHFGDDPLLRRRRGARDARRRLDHHDRDREAERSAEAFGGGIDPFDFFFPDPRNPQRRSPRGNSDGGDDERPQRSGGSGFIISPDGYILTNNHVVEGATKVDVHFGADENGNGGRTIPAKIIGRDPATDIALVKIEAGQNLPYITLGDSDRIRKGDWAIAIGNPFQLENTLTVGVISAKGRSLGFSEETRSFENFIQTDAAINFGNSGGPLMNINGEVVGINTAIRGGGAQGLGFATPINTAKRLLPQLKLGKVTRGYLGMTITEVSEDARQAFNLPSDTRGAIVQNVTPGKPADKAGIQHGDIITEIDGKPIRSNRDLIDYISYLPVGSDVKITVLRNGQRQTVTARTAERPLEAASKDETPTSPTEPVRNKLGMSVQDLTPQVRQNYGLADDVRGSRGDEREGRLRRRRREHQRRRRDLGGPGPAHHERRRLPHGSRSPAQRAEGPDVRESTAARGGAPFSSYRFVEIP